MKTINEGGKEWEKNRDPSNTNSEETARKSGPPETVRVREDETVPSLDTLY
jgi:hypothetical protein